MLDQTTLAGLRMQGPLFNSLNLPEGLKRGVISNSGPHSERFMQRYEPDVLFYDVFWAVNGKDVLLVGPAPIDLVAQYKSMKIVAQPSGKTLKVRQHTSSVTYVHVVTPPAGTVSLDVNFNGVTQNIAVADNRSDFFAGENLLFTLSQNNDLEWIRDWASFHVTNQGATAVLVFDNRSTLYSVEDLEATLASVPGLRKFAVVPTPFNYPDADETYPKNWFWAHFMQPSVIVTMLRRYGERANAILNCDIDELAVPLTDETVFDGATRSRSGTVYFRTAWMEPVPDQVKEGRYLHRDFTRVASSVDVTRGGTAKWALAPNRRWLRRYHIMPFPHAVENRPMLTRHKPGSAYIAHYKAISNSWKYNRSVQVDSSDPLVTAPRIEDAYARAGWLSR